MPSPESIKANLMPSVPDGNNFLAPAHHALLSKSAFERSGSRFGEENASKQESRAPFEMRLASARGRRPAFVDLPPHQRDRLLIDACCIPGLDGGKVRLARLVTGSRAPAMRFQEIRGRVQRI